MEEGRPEEFEFYDEKDRSIKIVRVKRTRGLKKEDLGARIFDIISTKGEYRQLIVFKNEVSGRWDCERRTEIVPLNQAWPEDKEIFIPNPISFEYKNEKYWVMKGNEEIVKEIKRIMQGAVIIKKKPRFEVW
ncbi:hypothetical protein ES702_05265 [subsurface metagenome]